MTKYNEDAYEEDGRPVKKSSGQARKSSGHPHKSSGSKKSSTGSSKKGNSSKGGGSKPKGGKKLSKKEQARKQRRRIILFILEIFVLVIMVVVLYGVLQTEKTGKVELKESDIIINDTVKQEEQASMKGYRNIALFGVDSTTGALTKNTRSDTIMIASVDQDTGACKLVSVYRDTYLNLSNDSYNKCNSAYAKGGPEMAISMLNMNLDMNITDFVTVGFAGLTDTIDALGGVYIDVDDAEINHLNNYQLCIAEDLKRTYTPVSNTGYQILNGLQATGYCRIRYTAGDDFKRTERQREVLSAVADQAKKANPLQLAEIANNVFEEVYTSLDVSEIVALLGDVGKYNIVGQAGFPNETYRRTGTVGSKGSCVIPDDLETNVRWLHSFLFENESYEPSDMVKTCSRKIAEDTAGAK